MEERPLLESWKEISAYLQRSEKTCRRWESTLDLPVHRLDGTPRARVFAYPDELDSWLAGKLHKIDEESEAEVVSTRKKWWRLAAAAGAVVVLAAFVALILLPPRLLPVPADKPSLAVVPFEFTGGEAGLEAWRTAFPDLLITSLLQSRYVNVLGITDLTRKLRDAGLGEAGRFSDDDLKKLADATKADLIATGTISRDGPNMAIAVSVRNMASGETGQPIRATFRGEDDVFAAADKLSEDIRRSVGLTRRQISHDLVKRVARVSTASPQAFKLCSQGYRLAGIAKYQEAIPVLQKAVDADPKFALAYKYLYRACLSARREDDAERYLLKAVELAGRLSEREGGEVLWFYYDSDGKDEAKKVKVLERLCRFYPGDRVGSMGLLTIYEKAEDWDKALPVAERAWAANKTEISFCQQLARCYEALGRRDRAERVLTEFMEINPGHPNYGGALSQRSDCLLRQGKFDAALADVDRMIALYPNLLSSWRRRGVVNMYRHDLDGAERDFRKFLDLGDPRTQIEALLCLRDLALMRGKIGKAQGHLLAGLEIVGRSDGKGFHPQATTGPLHADLAYLYRLTGKLADALKEVEAALRLFEGSEAGPPVILLRLKALINLDMGKTGEFEKGAEEICQSIEVRNRPKLMRAYYYVLGHRELRNNNLRAAVDYFSKALDLVSISSAGLGADPEYLYALADTYARLEAKSNPVQASAAFEAITSPAVNRLHCGDLYARSLFRLGELYDRFHLQGYMTVDQARTYRAKAVDCYRQFIGLWGDADPIFQSEVETARTRLAALEAE